MRLNKIIIAVILVIGFSMKLGELSAQQRRLIVGTKESAPFALKNKQGNWTGISIELWQQIADELNLDFQLREMELNELLEGVKDGSLDAAVAAFTITSEREEYLDFSHPYYTTGLSIAVGYENKGAWANYIKRIFSMNVLKVLFLLALLLFGVGLLVWLFERKRNPEQFGGSTLSGVGSGFWWSAVTMTTVGYGDKAPSSIGGRLIGLIWMFAGIIMISSFTAAITSELTVSQLETVVRGPEDLPAVRVGTVAGSTSESYLQNQRLSFRTYDSAIECLGAIEKRQIDAVVYDAPILRYLANTELKGKTRVLPNTFEGQYYGIALQQNSPLRESINRVLLHNITQPEWQDLLYRYLGN